MTDKTDSKEREALRSIGEEQAFEAWFKVDCPAEGANAKIAAKAAWKARASIAPSGFDAADMATASAQGFRDGVASVAASAGSEPVAQAEGVFEFWWADHMPNATQAEAWREWCELMRPGPVAVTHPSPPEGMVGGWMPIETAPKDGTAILLGSRGGSWIGKWLPVYGSGYRPENPWSSLMLNHDHMGEKRCKPTHWMPLPPPPTTPAGSGKGEA